MSEKCKHGAAKGRGRRGRYRCPVSTCKCCGSMFGFVNSASGFVGSRQSEVKEWHPRNLCGACGGNYIEYCTWNAQ